MFKDFYTYLSQFPKDRICIILDFFKQRFTRAERKAELLEQAAHYLAENPVSWLFQLTERDLYVLRKLCHARTGSRVELDMPEFPSLLAILRLVTEDEEEDGHIYVSAPYFILAVISPFIDDVIDDKERMGLFRADRIALGVLNIYGVIELTEFAEAVWDMFFKSNTLDKAKEIATCHTVAMNQLKYGGSFYLVSPYVADYEQIIEERKNIKKVRKYAHITVAEALSAGSNPPYCVYGAGKPALEAVRSELKMLDYTESEIERILTEIWMHSQFATEEAYAEAMFKCVNDKMEQIPSFEEYKRIVETIATYANHTPKWLLKGRKPSDVDFLKISIKVEDGDMEEPWDGDEPETETSVTPDPLEAFYRNSMAVRHVHPDAPCPCGSGLSYKNCHGRKLS